jgi:hypothetical protein
MSGGNGKKKTTEQHRTLCSPSAQAPDAAERKRFNTEDTESGAQSSLRRLAAELLVAVAGYGMIVDHAGGLHQRVANCGTDEAEAAFR